MRFIDFISFGDYSFSNQDGFTKLMRKFLMSHTLRPYTEAIMRDPQQAEFFRAVIAPLFQEYWDRIENVGFFSQARDFFSSFKNPLVEDALKDIALIASHDPATTVISLKISELVVDNGKICLQKEHEIALEKAFEYYLNGEFVSFDNYMRIYFSDNYDRTFLSLTDKDKITITLQQFISYFLFIISIIKPYTELSLESENKEQANDLCEYIHRLENHINTYNEELKGLTGELESIELRIHQYQKYHLEHSNEAPPEGHGKNCNATVTYEGIVSSWKMFMKIETLKKFYIQKQENYINKLHFMSDSHGNVNKENVFIKSFFEKLNYWQQNIPLIHRRQSDIMLLHQFNPDSSARKNNNSTDILYRNITEGEYKSIVELKQFSQKRQQGSFEREKWFYKRGGNPGHSSDYDYQSIIYLKSGALLLLNQLRKDAGCQAVILMKENEYECIGIHEDALPFFNCLILKVEIINRKTNKKKEIIFSESNDLALKLMVTPYQLCNPLFFLEPYRNNYPAFSSSIPEIAITENDVNEFEEWIERNMTHDPFTRNRVDNRFSMIAYSFALQMSCYASALPRKIPVRRVNEKLTIKTVEYDYLFEESIVEQNNFLLINDIAKSNITTQDFSHKIFYLYYNYTFIMDLVIKSLINSIENQIYTNISDAEYENLIEKIKIKEQILNKADISSSQNIIEEVRDWTTAFREDFQECIVGYLIFIETANYIDIMLIEAYLFSEKIKLIMLQETEDGFFVKKNHLEAPDYLYEKFSHVLFDESNATWHQLSLIDKIKYQMKQPDDHDHVIHQKNLSNLSDTIDVPPTTAASTTVNAPVSNNHFPFFSSKKNAERQVSTNIHKEFLSETLNDSEDCSYSDEYSEMQDSNTNIACSTSSDTSSGLNSHGFFNGIELADSDFFNEFSDDFDDDDLESDNRIHTTYKG